ncbi:hypothetical protein GCM10022224_008500 [Nonomuraea antimicrobica]|uniref:Uncharacterized protein n=1 Tax=Nonomuraea antimicrobica TaxID=561173 RepID=A0ABP7B4M3_9ACTN
MDTTFPELTTRGKWFSAVRACTPARTLLRNDVRVRFVRPAETMAAECILIENPRDLQVSIPCSKWVRRSAVRSWHESSTSRTACHQGEVRTPRCAWTNGTSISTSGNSESPLYDPSNEAYARLAELGQLEATSVARLDLDKSKNFVKLRKVVQVSYAGEADELVVGLLEQ